MAAHAQYAFPIFTVPEIVSCLVDPAYFNLRVTADDIHKPMPATVQLIYAACLEFFMGLRPEMLEAPKQILLSKLDHPELYTDSVPMMMFHTHVTNLAKIAQVDFFTLQDLTRPDPARTRMILSALVNFAKFKQERQTTVVDEFARESEALRERRERLEMEIRRMREEVEAIRNQRAMDEPEVGKTKNATDALLAELSELKKHQTALAADLDALRKRKAELNERITHTQSLLHNAQQVGHSARSRLVQSPERQKRAISEMGDELGAEKVQEAQYERRTRDLQARIAVMETFEQDILACSALLDQIEVEQGKVDAAARNVAQLKDAIERSTKDTTDLDVRHTQLTKQLEHAAERLERTTRQAEDKRAAIVAQMKVLKAEHDVISAERHARNREMEEKRDRNARLDEEIREIQKNAEADTAALAAAWAALEEHVHNYVDQMTSRLNAART